MRYMWEPPTVAEHNFRQLKKKYAALGITLSRNQRDNFKRLWPFRTSPSAGSGPVLYFNTIEQLNQHVNNIQVIRSWQS